MVEKGKVDWTQLSTIIIALGALWLSVFQFYTRSIQEIHQFSWVFFGNGIYIVNSGNRTEVVTEAGYSYTDGHIYLNADPARTVIVKPGDAQFVVLPSFDQNRINTSFPNGYSTLVDVNILDTRSGPSQNREIIRGGAKISQTTIQAGIPHNALSVVVYHDAYSTSVPGVLAP